MGGFGMGGGGTDEEPDLLSRPFPKAKNRPFSEADSSPPKRSRQAPCLHENAKPP